jgi:hypothetical protein
MDCTRLFVSSPRSEQIIQPGKVCNGWKADNPSDQLQRQLSANAANQREFTRALQSAARSKSETEP